jgi:hypothetical protein
MLPFPSKINNHKHRSNVYDEGKKRLDEKMIGWEKNVETREMKKYGEGEMKIKKKNGIIRLRDGKEER